jgi:hypothetical protein
MLYSGILVAFYPRLENMLHEKVILESEMRIIDSR